METDTKHASEILLRLICALSGPPPGVSGAYHSPGLTIPVVQPGDRGTVARADSGGPGNRPRATRAVVKRVSGRLLRRLRLSNARAEGAKTDDLRLPAVCHRLSDLQAQGRHWEALILAEMALQLGEERLGPESLSVAICLDKLAEIHVALGRTAAAELFVRRALAIREAALASDHPDVAVTLNDLAGLRTARGRDAEGLLLYRRALEIWEKSLGPDHPDSAAARANLARLLEETDRSAEAAGNRD